jgi:glycerate dehydrogenase
MRDAPSERSVLVTFASSPEIREQLGGVLDGVASITYLADLDEGERAGALASADAIVAWFLQRELRDAGEFRQLESVGLIQLLAAGVDHVAFDRIPDRVPLASNAGAYADPMAEHVLAMALALAKRLPQNHAAMARGEFNQQTPTRAIRGSVVGILGFGGIGQASAKLFKAFGARVHAINTSGQTDEALEWIGTIADLDALLAAADILVLSVPLTRTTRGLIGERELSLMKADAILVNVARAPIIDEDALYEHLRRNPSFSAGIDAWWQEPLVHGSFSTRRPFFELPNLLGSPHNSGITAGSLAHATRRAAENIKRFLRGEPVQHLVERSAYITE